MSEPDDAAQPSSREEVFVEASNPYDKRTRVWIVGRQANTVYRWMWLEPGETRRVKVNVEHAPDPKAEGGHNDVGLHTYAENPYDDPQTNY